MRRALPFVALCVAFLVSPADARAASDTFTFVEGGFALSSRGLVPGGGNANDTAWHVPVGKLVGTVDDLMVELGGLGILTGPLEAMFGFSNVLQPGKGWVEGINLAVGFKLVQAYLYVGGQLRFDHLKVAMNTPTTNACACLWAGGGAQLGVPWLALTYQGHFGTGLFIGNGLIGGGSAALHVTPIAGFLGFYVRYGATAFRNSAESGAPFLGATGEIGISAGGFGFSGLGG